MKIKLLVILFLTIGIAKAQPSAGVKFEKGLSWAQIQEKAKKENKYIFVDVFTTWCGPCKLMERDIFPQAQVGDFFNTNFINVKVQADLTDRDSEEVKNWYKDAQAIVTTYNVDTYPVYLFFSPKGELVHRLNGASPTAADFIAKAELALSGYPSEKWQFLKGKKDQDFLLKLLKSAQLMNDREFIPVVANSYLATQENLLTEENIKLIAVSTRKVADPGFPVLRSHADKADLILGKGRSELIVKTVVFDELVLPYLRINGVKKDYGGGMVSYSGKVNEHVNWDELKQTLDVKFPDLADAILMNSKPMYYQWTKNWPAYASYITSMERQLDNQQLDSYANNLFLFCEDTESLKAALKWSKELALHKDKNNPRFLYTYANLLYKTGKTEEAMKTMGEAVELAGANGQFLAEILEKMKSGKKTW
ncbi:DUF255 domain-containing protein [Pontibacter mangrovi]|uniref:DUF255 domain-containing protein n=1 Tax=Pontibacter mangrovi TaxID=2589816 RepID=A0A501W434_9BACT|nr:DUF255 domain-containing protein [Pontibacter mangrovi]TPE43395.1 DUF255 domain-containing protein [Pontibacter mangrovi]